MVLYQASRFFSGGLLFINPRLGKL